MSIWPPIETYEQAVARVENEKPKVVDMRTRRAYSPEGRRLAETLKAIEDSFKPTGAA